jgi:hypothetical protein
MHTTFVYKTVMSCLEVFHEFEATKSFASNSPNQVLVISPGFVASSCDSTTLPIGNTKFSWFLCV